MITQPQLKKLIKYYPHSGRFNWIYDNRRAGTSHGNIIIDSELYKKEKLAWLYMIGVYPDNPIGFIDNCRQNFKFANLSSSIKPFKNKIKITVISNHDKYQILIDNNDLGNYTDFNQMLETLNTCLKSMIEK